MKKPLLIALFLLLATQADLFAWNAEEMLMLFRRGERYFEEGKYKEAIIEFEKVLDMSPDNKLAIEHIKEARAQMRSVEILEARRENERRTWGEQEKAQEKLDKRRQQRYKKEQEQEMGEQLKLELDQLKLAKQLQEKYEGERIKYKTELERIKVEQQRAAMEALIQEEAEKLRKLQEAVTFPLKGYREEKGGGQDDKKSGVKQADCGNGCK